MNIQHLKYAVEVEKTGSISQAADNLYMNQPNLSKSIKELESFLGTALFQRTSKGVVPTPKGREFLVYARNVLAQIDQMVTLCRPASADRQRLRVSVPRASYISSAFTDFVNTLDVNKEIDINFRETNSMRAIRNITEGSSDLGIIRYREDHEPYYHNFISVKELSIEQLCSFEYLLLFSQEHPLAREGAHISAESLENYIQITHGDTTVPYLSRSNDTTETTPSSPRHIYVYERGSQFDLLTRVPTTYMWSSVVPREILERYRLVQRSCSAPGNFYRDALVYHRDHKYTPLEEGFVKAVKQAWGESGIV